MLEESKTRTAGPEIQAHSHGIPVHIEEHCWKDMFKWCRNTPGEVSGLGLVTLIDGVFNVSRVFLPEQRCSMGYTKIGPEAQGRLMYSLYKQKLPIENLRFWWHTHGNGSVFWSGTDDDQAQQLAHSNGEWSLSLVINQRGDSLCRADLVRPVGVMLDELDISLVDNTRKPPKRNYKSDIKRWVKPFKEEVVVMVFPREDKTQMGFHIPNSKWVAYRGEMLELADYEKLRDCFCGDQTCIDCTDMLKSYGIGEYVYG